MNKTITWLHISDRHIGKPGASWDATRVIDTLVTDFKKMERDHGLHPDYIFFTGDAAYGQLGSNENEALVNQLSSAQEFFNSVRQAFSPEVPATNLFIVPGNHDLNRKKVEEAQTFWLDNQKDYLVIDNHMETKSFQWSHLMDRLEEYKQFLSVNGYSHLLSDKDHLVYSVLTEKSGVTVGIGGFNTAWSCCRDNEKSKLWMGSHWQLEHLHSKLKNTDFSIAIMHHPPNWLTEYEDPHFKTGLERDFKFILHGHEHTNWVNPSSEGYTWIAAGACYEHSDKANGYNFVRIDLETGKGEVFLRKYETNGGGWVPCTVYGKTDNN